MSAKRNGGSGGPAMGVVTSCVKCRCATPLRKHHPERRSKFYYATTELTRPGYGRQHGCGWNEFVKISLMRANVVFDAMRFRRIRLV